MAWQDSLYGPGGFYTASGAPRGAFRTASHAAPAELAAALARLAAEHRCTRVVDVGAGGGELLAALAAAAPHLRLDGVDVAPRPDGLDPGIGWGSAVPGPLEDTLLVGWELLDVVPCVVAEAGPDGVLREVLVGRDGRESVGTELPPADLAWCDRWWPGPWAPGDRVEVGLTRDTAWSDLLSHLRSGVALAVDYDHALGGRPAAGTLTGYRSGRVVPPVPDGSCDLTAHVALDSVAAAVGALVMRQAEALRLLGVDGRRPAPGPDPVAHLHALAAAGRAAELLDSGGLGGFGWLVSPRPRG